jgi:hypothetical protein
MVKLFQETIGNTLDHKGTGNNFLKGTPIAQQLECTDKWDCMKQNTSVLKRKQSPD